MESLPEAPRYLSKPVLQISPPDQRPDWAEDTGNWEVSPGLLPWQPAQLEPLPPVGRVCTKFPQANHHRPHPLPVHTRPPTPSVSLDGRALRRSSCGPLVLGDSAHIHLQQAVRRHKSFADARQSHAPVYHPGDQVWLSTRDLRLRLPCRKLSPRYIGPFTIERQINEVTFLLQLPARYRIHPAFHISLLKPFSPSVSGSEEPAAPPPPEVQAEPSIY